MGERRSGLLVPRVSWRNDENYQLTVPVYFTLGTSADLEIAPGLRNGSTPVQTARMRWATQQGKRGVVEALALGQAIRIESHGHIGLGRLSLHTAGEFLSVPGERHRLTHDWQQSRRLHTAGSVSARAHFDNMHLQLDGLIVQDADWDNAWSKREFQNP